MRPRALPRSEFRFHENTPLARLVNQRQNEREFGRVRRLGNLLEQFQLKFTVTSRVNGRQAVVNGRSVLHFASHNYLGLEQHPEVLYASKRAIDELGTDPGCPRLFSTQSNLLELEESLSQLLRSEATLVGSSPAQIHATALPALFGEDRCVLFLDRNTNTSLQEAAALAQARGARLVKVDVSDPPALRRILSRENPRAGALLVDGVNSTTGHTPDLAHLEELARASGLILYVDDSHGIGVLGHHGGGAAEVFGLGFSNLLLVGSLSHAFGTFGGFLSGKDPAIRFLREHCPSFHSLETLQPSAVEGALASVRISRSPEGQRLREQLARSSRKLRERLKRLGYIVPPGDSPLIPVQIGKDLKTVMAGRKLFDLGVFVSVLSFPAVPHGKGVLRISVTTLHSDEDLEKLVLAFASLRDYLPQHENPLRQAAHIVAEVARAKWMGSRYKLAP